MCVSFNNIYNGTTNHSSSIASISNPNRVTILENTQVNYIDDEIYVANINPIHLHSMNSNYLHVLDEMLRQSKETGTSITGVNIHELQYLLGSMILLYGIYYCIEKIISIYDK